MSEQALSGDRHHVSARVALPVLIGGLAYLLMVVAGGRMLNDPDIYWHIATGNWILGHKAFPLADPFSNSMPGAPWLAMEWLSQVIFATVFANFGWTGIVLVSAAGAALGFALLARTLSRELGGMPTLVLCLAALMLTASHLVARPHVLVLPVMVAWIAALVRAADNGSRPPYWILPLMVLWTNLHASSTLGLAFILPLGLDAVLTAPAAARRPVAFGWIGFWVLAAGAACLTPYGAGPLLSGAHILGLGDALNIVSEWKPQDFSHPGPFEALLLAAIGFVLYRGLTLPPLRIVLVLGLLHLALSHVRHGEELGLLAPLLIARPLSRQLRGSGNGEGSRQLAIAPAWFAGATAGALVCVSALFAMTATPSPPPGITPREALEALRAQTPGRIFNDYGFGGYMIFAGDHPFIDGRQELYGHDLNIRYARAVSLQDLPDFIALLDQYKIEATLLIPAEPAAALLDRLPGWKRVYGDNVAVVHVRTAPLKN